ncbi:MAG TPA: transporter associated domain-containing protein, partial [Rhizobiaceae bacterium]|nr:transporter associated domain-containing protein [Rhizobiaceae bacterium]
EEVDTLGGLIVARLGRVPARGEVVPPFAGYEFQVVEADPRRVKRVRIVPDRAMARRRVQRKEPAVNALPAPMTAPAAEPAPEQEAAPQVIGVEGAEGGR